MFKVNFSKQYKEFINYLYNKKYKKFVKIIWGVLITTLYCWSPRFRLIDLVTYVICTVPF